MYHVELKRVDHEVLIVTRLNELFLGVELMYHVELKRVDHEVSVVM